MSDEPELSVADAERIRALLADARVTSPAPDDVVSRLDAVLAGLRTDHVAEDTGPAEGAGTVVPLWRRVAPRLLPAAAAVIVLGGAAYGVSRLHAGGAANDSTASGASSGTAPQKATAGSSGSSFAGRVPLPSSTLRGLVRGGVPTIRTAQLARDTRHALAATRAPAATPSTDSSTRKDAAAELAIRTCPGPALPRTTTEPIILDDALAALVAHRATPSGRLVELWSCSGDQRLTTLTLPPQLSGAKH